MDDAACFRDHAERYRKLADAFRDHRIGARLAVLADELDIAARRLPRQRAGATRCERPSTHMQRLEEAGKAPAKGKPAEVDRRPA
jgi:hypothetical protein